MNINVCLVQCSYHFVDKELFIMEYANELNINLFYVQVEGLSFNLSRSTMPLFIGLIK